ncbi:MAG TPA: GatB/YqeY domain-containing protein, partial [Nannocystaceae bacterium]|nr:GatB/YqeY domain-containing protein [Nannocystaceae bacterium]
TLNVIGMLKNKVLMELKSGSGAEETDELWKSVLGSYAKQLRKSIPEFEKVGERGKEALAEVAFELGFCEQFLPAKLDEAATEALVRKLVDEQGLAGQGAKAQGRVMGLLMKQHRDEIDGDIAKAVVARVLAG